MPIIIYEWHVKTRIYLKIKQIWSDYSHRYKLYKIYDDVRNFG